MARMPLFLLAALPLLGACSPAIISPLKLSEVAAVGDTGVQRQITATLHIPLPASADCQAGIASHVAKLAEIMPVSGGTCFTDMSDPHAEIETTVWVIPIESERPEHAGLVLEVATGTDHGKVYEVTVFSRVTLDEIERQLGFEGAVTDPEIVFALENDLGREVGVQFSSVFYENRPTTDEAGILFPEKDISIVRLSDVSTAIVAESNGDTFMSIYDIHWHADTE